MNLFRYDIIRTFSFVLIAKELQKKFGCLHFCNLHVLIWSVTNLFLYIVFWLTDLKFILDYFAYSIFTLTFSLLHAASRVNSPLKTLPFHYYPQDSERNPSYRVSYFYCNVVVVRSMHQNWSELPLSIPATAMPRGRILHLKDLLNYQRFYLSYSYHSKNPFHFKTSAMNIMLYVVFGQRGD